MSTSVFKYDSMSDFEGNTLFTKLEMACPLTGKVALDPNFYIALRNLRIAVGVPMFPSSMCRSEEHNKIIGGHPNSFHLITGNSWGAIGTASFDLKNADNPNMTKIVIEALNSGWSMLIYGWGVHLDRRVDFGLPQTIKYMKG